MAQIERVRTRRWTRLEYDRLIEHGFLDEDEPIELLDGLMVVKEPKGRPHVIAVGLVADALRITFGAGWFVQVQDPIALDDRSEPEPDVCVVRGSLRDYRDHPTRPALIVEVADSGLRLARGRKAMMYARAGISDYWILNLVGRRLEIYRDPVAARGSRSRYRSIQTFGANETVSPLAMPSAQIAVADLLP